jgi:hypothetical protein
MRVLSVFMVLLFIGPRADSQSAKLPLFADYPAVENYSGKPAAPMLQTAAQRKFRTMIREGAAKGPNFAGRYTIADWGCGAGCVSIAVIDAKDGKVYDGPFQVLSWAMFTYEGKYKSNTPEFAPLNFQKGSRLLIARGCPEETNCASYFYEWAAPKFKLIRKLEATAIPQ